MSWTKHDYDDIPGTYVFDGKHAHGAYSLNRLLFSLNEAVNRESFERDPSAYCDEYGVGGKHKDLVLNKDFLGMLRAGANIYYLAKMAVPRGTSVQDAGARFQNISTQEFQARLLAKGNDLAQRLAKRGGFWNG
jgi:protocatechuate 4,5-dioxygenase, alpha chain